MKTSAPLRRWVRFWQRRSSGSLGTYRGAGINPLPFSCLFHHPKDTGGMPTCSGKTESTGVITLGITLDGSQTMFKIIEYNLATGHSEQLTVVPTIDEMKSFVSTYLQSDKSSDHVIYSQEETETDEMVHPYPTY